MIISGENLHCSKTHQASQNGPDQGGRLDVERVSLGPVADPRWGPPLVGKWLS